MALLKSNESVGQPSGAVGELVYAKYADGRVVIRRKPGPETQQTANEQAAQSRFRRAVAYRQSVVSDPAMKLPYQTAARIRRKRACDLALSDYLKAPVIQNIDASGYTGKPGQEIAIEVIDDFEVISVEVLIRSLDNVSTEGGSAVCQSADSWVYTARNTVAVGQTVVIEVMAADRAGNVARKVVHHATPPPMD